MSHQNVQLLHRLLTSLLNRLLFSTLAASIDHQSLSLGVGPHHWRYCQFSLATTIRAHLNRRSSSTEPSTTRLLGVCLISSATSLICRREVNFQTSRRPPFTTRHCPWSFILYCWTTALEQPTWRRPVCLVTDHISAKTEIAFIYAVMPWHYSVLVPSP